MYNKPLGVPASMSLSLLYIFVCSKQIPGSPRMQTSAYVQANPFAGHRGWVSGVPAIGSCDGLSPETTNAIAGIAAGMTSRVTPSQWRAWTLSSGRSVRPTAALASYAKRYDRSEWMFNETKAHWLGLHGHHATLPQEVMFFGAHAMSCDVRFTCLCA